MLALLVLHRQQYDGRMSVQLMLAAYVLVTSCHVCQVVNLTTGLPYLMFFTACDISANEELLWSYGNDAAFFSHIAAEQLRCGAMLVRRPALFDPSARQARSSC